MVETDAPYLGFPGCRIGYKKSAAGQNPNVPSSLPLIVKTLAKVLKRDVNEIAMITSQNAELHDFTSNCATADYKKVR